MAKALSGLVRKIAKEKLLQGVNVLHDDIVFMCEANHQNKFTIQPILRCFELVSRLMIIFHKSMIRVIDVEQGMMYYFAKTLNCTQMSIPFKYLGLLMGGNKKKTTILGTCHK